MIRSVHRLAPLILVLALVGCKNASKRVVEIEGPDLSPGEAMAVDVTNFSGDVSIIADDTREKLVVKAKLRAPAGTRLSVKNRRKEGVWIGAEVVEDEGGAILRVLSRPTEVEGSDQVRVALSIVVPSCNGVLVRNTGGRVLLRNVNGAIQVDNGYAGTEGGAIDVRTSKALNAPIALTTTDGHVYLQMSDTSAGSLDVSTDDGRATVRAHIGDLDDVMVSTTRWTGILNDGANPILLKTSEGDARIIVLDAAGQSKPSDDY